MGKTIDLKVVDGIMEDIMPEGLASAYSVLGTPFDEAKRDLERKYYGIISGSQNAYLRICEEEESSVSRDGNFVIESFVHIPDVGNFLTKNSPIIKNPVEATSAHQRRTEYVLTYEQAQEALKSSVKISPSLKSISTDSFKENEVTNFLFENFAESYGKFLRGKLGIKRMSINLPDPFAKPFARQIYLCGISNNSAIDCSNQNLFIGYRVRGIKEYVGRALHEGRISRVVGF